MWHIALFGGLQARHGDRVFTQFNTIKDIELLAYLALYPGKAHSREELMGRLWPDAHPGRGRANLRQSFHKLRHALELPLASDGLLIAKRDTICLNAPLAQTDVHAFLARLETARNVAAPAEKIAALTEATALYAGPFLMGHDADWILEERQRLAGMQLAALMALTQLLAKQGEGRQAIAAAQRAVALDPARERLHFDLMRLLRDDGQPEAALRQYEELKHTLKKELGEKPAAAVRAFAATLRQQAEEEAGRIVAVKLAPPHANGNGAASPHANGNGASPHSPESVAAERLDDPLPDARPAIEQLPATPESEPEHTPRPAALPRRRRLARALLCSAPLLALLLFLPRLARRPAHPADPSGRKAAPLPQSRAPEAVQKPAATQSAASHQEPPKQPTTPKRSAGPKQTPQEKQPKENKAGSNFNTDPPAQRKAEGDSPPPARAELPTYEVQILPIPTRYEDGDPCPAALTEDGDVVGRATSHSVPGVALLWSNGGYEELGAFLPGEASAAWDVNENYIVGTAGYRIGMPEAQAFLIRRGEKITREAMLPGPEETGDWYAIARAVNREGQAAGYVIKDDPIHFDKRIAAFWPGGGLPPRAFLAPGGTYSHAEEINDAGLVVGWMDTAVGTIRGFVWDTRKGEQRALDTLGGQESKAFAINERGWIAGSARDLHGHRPCLWKPGEKPRDLSPEGWGQGLAQGINREGAVVGWIHNKNGPQVAFVWREEWGMLDLNQRLKSPIPGARLKNAFGINDRGQIIVHGEHNGRLRVFLLTPIH